ncbi:MAG: 15-cis-phytoene synthase [Frankiaceae bacterium]|nr:15-cis-phytoene synthase [Frankiaceae bacterium]
MTTLAEAYAYCDRVTRTEAANFSYGIRLLPPGKRSALSAVYALARRIDDIGDGPATLADKSAALAALRAEVGRISIDSADPVLVAVADSARRFPLPLAAFGELIDGVQMDLDGVTYATIDELEQYCIRVAGSIGRLSVAIFAPTAPPPAARLADRLGLALQLTNILRDIREDLGAGRIYLPSEDLATYGAQLVLQPDGTVADPDFRVARLIRFEAARAERWYADGLQLLQLLDHRSAACTGAMAGIYRRLLRRISRHPGEVLRTRVSLPAWEKAIVAAGNVVGVRQ